jgi:hypothetical protein
MGRTRQSADLVSDNNIFVDISNDKVGIGTTAPSEQLTVSGITSTSNLNVVGVATATTFVGDGSQLTGLNVPAGYGDLDALLFT